LPLRRGYKPAPGRHAANTSAGQTGVHAGTTGTGTAVEELMSLNIFAFSPLAPLIGMLLFGGLLALPLYYDGDPRPAPPAACCAQAR